MATIPINNFNLGGISESKYSGNKYTLSKMVGVDVHTEPGAIKAQYQMVKESGSTIDAPVHVILPCSDGNTYMLSRTTGKVWKRDSSATYSLVHTTTPAAGAAGCLGAAEYNGYIYWATQSRLHRIAISGLGDWATNAAEDWATFTVKDAEFHPMTIVNTVLYIGDGYLVAQVDGSTFTADALDVQTPQRVCSLGKALTDLVIGTHVNDNVNKSSIYDWNTWSVSFSSEDEIEEVRIYAFLKMDNYLMVSAGESGSLYSYNLQELTKIKQLPGLYTSSASGIVYPHAVANIRSLPVFGFSQLVGNPTEFGIYSWGRVNPLFPEILVLEYPLYPSSSMVTADIKVHSMATVGGVLLAAWEYDSTYGVSKLDYTARANGAYFDTLVMRGDRDVSKTVQGLYANYSSIPTGTSISMKYKANYDSSWTDVTLVDNALEKRYEGNVSIKANTFEVRTIFNTSGANTPIIDEIGIVIE